MVRDMELRVLAYSVLGLIPFFLIYTSTHLVNISYVQLSMPCLLLLIIASVFRIVKDVGVCQPFSVVTVILLMGFHAKYLYIVSGLGLNRIIDEVLLLDQGINILDSGMVFVSITFISMALFYILGKKRQYTKPLAIECYVYTDKFIFIGTLILAISILAFSLSMFSSDIGFVSGKKFSLDGSLPNDRFGSLSYYLLKLSFLSKVAFYIFLLSYLSPSKKWVSLFLLIISFMATLVISFYVSNRASLVVLFIDLVVVMTVYKGRVPLKQIIAVLIVMIVAILIISNSRSEFGATKSIADHLFGGRYLFELTKNTHFYNYLASGQQLLHYSSGAFLTDYINLGRSSGMNVFGMEASGVPLGFPIELFAVGGWLLLTIGMGALGLFYRALTRLVTKKIVKDYIVVVYSIIMTRTVVFMFNNGLGVTIYQTFLDLIPFMMVIYFLKPKQGLVVGTKAYS